MTTLLEPTAAPATELAALYHERWESEGTFAELKVSLPGKRLMLRSRRADLAEQELYGLLLAHFALRRPIHDASQQVGCDPVLPPHGAHRPPALAVPCRVFPLAGGAACMS